MNGARAIPEELNTAAPALGTRFTPITQTRIERLERTLQLLNQQKGSADALRTRAKRTLFLFAVRQCNRFDAKPTPTPTKTTAPTFTPTNTPTSAPTATPTVTSTPTSGGSMACNPNAGTALGALDVYSLQYTIGIDQMLTGDSNHNAQMSVQYRVQGTSIWRPAMDLVRVDMKDTKAIAYNMLSGSIFSLAPGTAYEVELRITDPDGCSGSKIVNISTKSIPSLPAGARRITVTPATFDQALDDALPGDILLLHAGTYGEVVIDKSGTAGQYIALKAFGDGEVNMNGTTELSNAKYIWLEGLTWKNLRNGPFEPGIKAYGTSNIVVSHCKFLNDDWGIYMKESPANSMWYIADNTFVGTNVLPTGTDQDLDWSEGEGIEMWSASHMTVIYNSFSRMADAVSYPGKDVDIFWNDIFDTSDDAIEGDRGYQNVRSVGNRITNIGNNIFSFQPMNIGPWYFLRNQVIGYGESLIKFRDQDNPPDRFVMLHNTFVGWSDYRGFSNWDYFLRGISKNNIWISMQGARLWPFAGKKDWRTAEDYDAFDWAANSSPFSYNGTTYPDIARFAAASGLELHGLRISRGSCLPSLSFSAAVKTSNGDVGPIPGAIPVNQDLSLASNCAAVNAGEVLPNINDDYVGAAPDIGALEFGNAAPHYGPRP